ncbi:hypothetical protein [Planomonospora parontospora]|uniref:phosphotriesterase family protein n=1 Tax=Planomonospora parontospora TaxID=58119 RepID=UPI001EF493C0|nr:hypothetical protein [Planomonospora parontospora]
MPQTRHGLNPRPSGRGARQDHIHDDVLPALREAGVTDAQIDRMLVDNPRRYFS